MKKYIVVVMSTVITIVAMWILGSIEKSGGEIAVVTVTPELKNIHDYINVNGRICEGNKKSVYLDGIYEVKKVYAEVGDSVKQGDKIADVVLCPDDLKDRSFDSIKIDDILTVFEDFASNEKSISDFSSTITTSSQSSTITSPIDGMITEMNLVEGENSGMIEKAFSVSDLSDLYVELEIPEEYSLKIKGDETVELSAEAFGGRIYNGKINEISPIAKQTYSLMGNSETYVEATADIISKDNLLRPGLSVNGKIRIKTIKDALVIPYECIVQDEKNNEFVFSVENNLVKKRFIQTGYELDNCVEIKSGIGMADEIIMNPDEGVENNKKVKKAEN